MKTRAESATLDYITKNFVREPSWLAPVREAGEKLRPGMQVSSFEGYLLRWLVGIGGGKRILEIGTFMGYSALWMAQALPAGGRLTALEFDPAYAAQARTHIAASPHAATIEVIAGDAHAWLAGQAKIPTYDLVFIDAEKKGYARYLAALLPLLNPRGFIIGDNTLLFGAMADDTAQSEAKEAMARFNATLADPQRFESILLPTPEGLTVARLR